MERAAGNHQQVTSSVAALGTACEPSAIRDHELGRHVEH